MTSTMDTDAIRRKYAEERAKRMRSDGVDQYVRMPRETGPDGDPHLPVLEREPKTDHVDFTFIGGGFSGLVTGARVKEAGLAKVRILDKAGDFGGVWYWNRYPGAMCDTASMVYMPLLEETGHVPTEKYAHGPEIYEHAQRIGKHYDLYEDALFHTAVTHVEWLEERSVWLVETNRGDAFTTQYLGMGTGPLHVAKLPGIPGIETFRGTSFHTSRWDYRYTGGDPDGSPMVNLRDKRVAIIGTGATAVQAVPELAKDCGELLVFQRTPSAVDVRDNQPIDPDWFARIATPGWQQRWLDSFIALWDSVLSDPSELDLDQEDLVQDGWTDLGRRMGRAIKSVPLDQLSPESVMLAIEAADNIKMNQIRSRVDEIVEDPATAAKLKAWYNQMCKRPCFHDDYLPAFNRPNVRLIDTDGRGVERITETGVVVDGELYEVDLIIYASGFEFYGTDATDRMGYDVFGREGLSLSAFWEDGMKTLWGQQVRGFPNLFIQQLFQGAFLGSNIPHNLVDTAKTIALTVKHMQENDLARVEPTQEAQDAWVDLLLTQGRTLGNPECTPGYYNNEGAELDLKARHNVGYPKGSAAFFTMMDAWRASGTFEGLAFS
ncbi:flavin-containing monooxygenase [Marmoricola sp. RAF53]|uniref:flavin-containing monooxygenase n=1 Tax=Marmoricola sp. RAF53 TaxID=3233059 RepID=UPI003F945EF3